MIIFSDEEIKYVRNYMENAVCIYNGNSMKDFRELMLRMDGEGLDTARIFCNCNAMFNDINNVKYENELFIKFIWWGMGLWCFPDRGIDTKEELLKLVDDKIYANLYEKILQSWD